MKEIVLISAYTPELHQIDRLRDLIISFKKLNYRVCLATHTPTPQDIIDRCDYFLYDSLLFFIPMSANFKCQN